MSKEFVYHNPRPRLTIEHTGSRNLGDCYNASYYRVTSTPFRLKLEQLHALRDADLLGMGQEFILKSQCDGKEAPAGEDEVTCIEVIDGVPQLGVAINPYTQKPYGTTKYPYFVYEIERRIDSGD